MIEKFLDLVINKEASDLHLSSNNLPVLRINGQLIKINDQNLSNEEVRKMASHILSPEQFSLLQKGQEIDHSFYYKKNRFRINCFRNINGMAISLRSLGNKIMSLSEINAPDIFYDLCNLRNGLIIVSGATGAGKSTTLAAMIDHINNNHDKHIISIEDPVEYVYHSKKSLINQVEVGRNTKSFADSLKNFLRQDPDIILVGEIRDIETMRLALTAAETGHLVLTTLHTNSVYNAINRIIDVFPQNDKNTIRSMLSLSLRAVICQRLVPTRQNKRCAAFEIMIENPAIRNLIRVDNIHNINSIIETHFRDGMITMENYLKELVRKKIIDEDQI